MTQWLKQKFFGAPSIDEVEDSLDTEQVLQTLKLKKMQHLQKSKRLEREARQYFEAGNKASASSVLKQKQAVDTRLKQIEGQIANMEHHNTTLESAALGVEMHKSMKNGIKEIQETMGKINVDDIEETTDDYNDLAVQAFEITGELARPVTDVYTPVDSDDLIEEQFAQWAQPTTTPTTIQVQQVENPDIVLPSVPSEVTPSTRIRLNKLRE